MGSAVPVATRAYSIACAVIVLLMFPRFVASFGVVRQHPLELRARPDVTAVSFGDGPWLPAKGIASARLIDGIPAGMRICHRFANGEVRCGEVRNVSEAPAQTAARTVTALLALAFVLAGAVLAIVGVDRRALAAAGMLAGLGLLFGVDFLEPALVAVRDLSVQLRLIALWAWFPRYAGLLCMLVFAREFPATLPPSRLTTALVATVTALVISATAINGVAHVPGLIDRISLPAQATVISLILLSQQLLYAGAALGVIVLTMRQRKHAAARPAQLRRSGRMVAAAIVFGFVPSMTLGLLQVILDFALGRRPIPFPLISASYLTLLAIPAAVMAAVMAKRIDSARIVARRALLFTLADRVFPLVKLIPLAAMAVLLYANRQRSIQSVVEEHPIELLLILVFGALLLAFGETIRRAVKTYFFRNEAATRERLAALPSLIAQTETVQAVARVLEQEIDQAFHPETVALLVRDEKEHAYRGVLCDVPMVSAASVIAAALEEARLPLSSSELLGRELAEMDRHWMAVTRAEMLVPLLATDQRMLGILAVGEKSSELPFDDLEKGMMMTAASACALTIENHRLRGQASVIDARSAGARSSDDDPALVCPACAGYYSPAVASRCPVHDRELQTTDVPYVLAGKYRFDQRLGAGAMGVVYRARDLELERDVAIKTLPRLSAETAARLRREARTAANLVHPNLATVFAVESWRGIPMLILEYLDDGTLSERVSRGRLPVETIVRCGGAIAEALGHVHARTILHRDVKPSNIGFSRGAGAKLLDFGLARLLEDGIVQVELFSHEDPGDTPDASQRLTVTSGIVGTPAYLSPEAILGQPAHPDFDLWSLSLTLYEAATGTNPFMERTVTATMNAILARSVPDPRELRSDCPEGLSRFLMESLDRRREKRPRSAMELASRLRELANRH